MTFNIHKPKVRFFPVICKHKGCADSGTIKYLPFNEVGSKWRLSSGVSDECQSCKILYGLMQISHLVIPNEDGSVHGSLEVSPGKFIQHPVKRWEFGCDSATRAYIAGQKDDFDYPHSFTVLPESTTCYECLEKAAEIDGEELQKRMDYFKTKE
tara:strand:+ start:1008 stop:1469 length:462 start_codon:yes stop_codon:yes gene_type:complete